MALEIANGLNGSEAPAPDERRRAAKGTGLRTIIIGAGEAGRFLARVLKRAPEYGLLPIGFLDDDPTKKGAAGLPVLGKLSDLVTKAEGHAADVVIVGIPSLAPADI